MSAREKTREDRIEELVVACLERAESTGEAGIEALLEREPELAGAVRAELEKLRTLGMLDVAGAGQDERRRLGPHHLLAELGRGSASVVWLAFDERLRRRVALKVFLGARAEQRMRAEAEALASLRHENVVTLHASGTSESESGESRAWLAAEWVDGKPLPAWLADAAGRRAPRVLLPLFAALARALAHAHERGVVHGDVRAANVLVRPDGRPVLVDFELGAASRADAGTFAHAAPERRAGGPATPEADQYALASVLAEALPAGERPVADLALVLATARAEAPRERYAGCVELAQDLDAVLAFAPLRARHQPWRRRAWRAARRRPWLAAAAGGVALAAVVATALAVAGAVHEHARREAVARAAAGRAAELLPRIESEARELARLRAEREADARLLEQGYVGAAGLAELAARGRDHAQAEIRVEALLRDARADLLAVEAHGGPDALSLRERAERAELAVAKARGDRQHVLALRAARERAGPGGGAAPEAGEHGTLELRAAAAGVTARLFAAVPFLDPDGLSAERTVWEPWPRGAREAPDAEVVLRVVDARGQLDPDDVIVRICGEPIADRVFALAAAEPVEAGDVLARIDGRPVHDLYAIDYVAAGEHAFAFTRGARQLELRGTRAGLGLRCGDARMLAEHGPAPGRALPVTVRGAGGTRESRLARGIVTRPTAAPLPAGGVGAVTLPARVALPEGEYLVHARAPGCCELRIPLRIAADAVLALDLAPPGLAARPPGFVPVLDPARPERWFWMQEREATVGEYLEFLNADPGAEQRVPRRGAGRGYEPFVARGESGRFELPPGWFEEHPVFGITRADAAAFAAWRTRRDGARYGVRFALPDAEQWRVASCAHVGRRYPWGEGFVPYWAKTQVARPALNLEPGLRFPRDESPFSIYDLGGNLAEWGGANADDAAARAPYLGGSVLERNADKLASAVSSDAPADVVSMAIGFRLVAIPSAAGGSRGTGAGR